jgi:ribosomal protein S18 acetylase RimI-like enzyme
MSGVDIRRYEAGDEDALLALLREEGDEWADYHAGKRRNDYARALSQSVTYVAVEGAALCGFVRCREDFGFGLYVYDLLVRRACRGQGIGRSLMERARLDFPGQDAYVMSDVDGYYEQLGYRRVGSVFEVGGRGGTQAGSGD